MEPRTLLEFDYSDPALPRKERVEHAGKNLLPPKSFFENDPVLKELSQEQQDDFYSLIFHCHLLAAQTRSEFSVAIEPGEETASVVIITKQMPLCSSTSVLLTSSIEKSKAFVMEAIDENGPKIVLYFLYELKTAES